MIILSFPNVIAYSKPFVTYSDKNVIREERRLNKNACTLNPYRNSKLLTTHFEKYWTALTAIYVPGWLSITRIQKSQAIGSKFFNIL